MEKIQITTSQIIKDLSEGLTWKKDENLGYGSIEEKYNLTINQVTILKQHPRFQEVMPKVKVELIDDVEEELRKKPEVNLQKKSEIKEEQIVNEIKEKHEKTDSLTAFKNI